MLRQKLDDITQMIFGGRYIILLMGLFSIFTGFMYNEFFSMPMSLFGSTRYACQPDPVNRPNHFVDFRECTKESNSSVYDSKAGLKFNTEEFSNPYPFGADPIWHGTRTELTYFNSVKMKMSILMVRFYGSDALPRSEAVNHCFCMPQCESNSGGACHMSCHTSLRAHHCN
jgi:V-type H+-transporting ATPase subunit a